MKLLTRALLGATLFCSLASAQTAPVAPENSVPNGDMEAGEAAPDGWKKEWVGAGEMALARDTETVHGGKAALKIEAKDAQAVAATFFEAPANARLQVSGWIKTAGAVKLSFGLSPRDKDWKKLSGDIQIGFLQGDNGWSLATKTVELPANTAHLGIAIYAEGTGQIWVDDVKVEAADAGQ